MFMPRKLVEDKLKAILADDIGQGDVTAAAVIPRDLAVKQKLSLKKTE